MTVDTTAPAEAPPEPPQHQLPSAPTLDEARIALTRIYGPHTEALWRTLLHHANLTGQETDSWAIDRLLSVMHVAEPMARLCARGLEVRVNTYRARLAAAGQN
ncbi:MAG: hypothetical protein ABW046_14405 [Actinoplanes sp.]